jgi:hypothetical protein
MSILRRPEFWTVIANFLLIVCAGGWFSAQVKHKLDVALERMRPLTAEETLRRENYLNSKSQAYYEAITLVSRWLAATPWSGPDVPRDRSLEGNRPSEAEINTGRAKLAMFVDNPEVLATFDTLFGPASAPLLGKFVEMARKDMGYTSIPVPADSYHYIFKRTPGAERR